MDEIHPFFHSKFKDLSNDTSHAQIQVKMKKLWPQQVGEEKQAAEQKLCRDISRLCCNRARRKPETLSQQIFFMSRQIQKKILSQQSSVCRDLGQNKAKTDFVVTKFYYVVTEFIFSQQSHSANFVATKFYYVAIEFTWSQQSHSANFVMTKFYYVVTEFTLSQQSHNENFVATKFYYVAT